MKKIIFVLATLMCLGCSCKQPNISSIPKMNYGDCEPEIVPMGIYFENVIDFTYASIDDMFIIEYADTDSDSIQIDGAWTLDYYQIECSKEQFFEVLEEYSNWTTTGIQKDLNWGFIEIVTPVEGGLNYRYSLVNLNL